MKKWLALGSVLTLFACQQNHPHRAEIEEIDSLLIHTDSMQEAVQALPEKELLNEFRHMDSLYQILTGPLVDKDNRDYWVKDLALMVYVHRTTNKFLYSRPKLEEELAYTKKQLQTLRNSIQDKKLSEEEMEKYLKIERKAYNSLRILYQKRMPSEVQNALRGWDTLQTQYSDMARSLQRSAQQNSSP